LNYKLNQWDLYCSSQWQKKVSCRWDRNALNVRNQTRGDFFFYGHGMGI